MPKHSELQVLHSNAGYYIGRNDAEGLPLSRESGYFPTYRNAEDALIKGFQIRDCVENNYAYDKGTLPDIRK